jgi:hypothetical protein
MDQEVEEVILKLKNVLDEKYGEDFKKFYLVKFSNSMWEGLIISNNEDSKRDGKYYSVEGETVIVK